MEKIDNEEEEEMGEIGEGIPSTAMPSFAPKGSKQLQ